MAKIVKLINDLNPNEAIFLKIESNTSLALQEDKQFSNHTTTSLCNRQLLQTTITIHK